MPTMSANGQSAFRISIQGYNSDSDVDRLLSTLKKFL